VSEQTKGRVFAMSAPAGTGKDTVIEHLKQSGCPIYCPVTYTTRGRRDGEIDGVHYHFVTRDVFEQMLAASAFLETAEYSGAQYGSPRQVVVEHLESGRHVLLKIEVKGTRSIRALFPGAVTIFLMPPSLEVSLARMKKRATESPEEQARRANIALLEMAAAPEFDYVVINEDNQLPQVVAQVRHIIETEGARPSTSLTAIP